MIILAGTSDMMIWMKNEHHQHTVNLTNKCTLTVPRSKKYERGSAISGNFHWFNLMINDKSPLSQLPIATASSNTPIHDKPLMSTPNLPETVFFWLFSDMLRWFELVIEKPIEKSMIQLQKPLKPPTRSSGSGCNNYSPHQILLLSTFSGTYMYDHSLSYISLISTFMCIHWKQRIPLDLPKLAKIPQQIQGSPAPKKHEDRSWSVFPPVGINRIHVFLPTHTGNILGIE